jgi:tripartite-type tricarboxylate transporter receptor subunit TctC
LFPADAADKYPSKPVQIVVPGAPGGDTDFWARIITKNMSQYLGEQAIVVNVAGGGGTIGSAKVKDSAPDGYTVLMYHPGMLLQTVTGSTKYGIDDFEMGAISVVDDSMALIVNAENKNLPDLAALANAIKEKPGTLRFAADTGGYAHFHALTFEQVTGGKFNIVDVGGQGPKVAALLGGQIDTMSAPLNTVKGFMESKKFRALGMMSEQRNPAYPDVPTFKELGYDLVFPKPYFLVFPKGTPESAIDTFNEALIKALKDPEMLKSLENDNVQASGLAKEEMRAYLTKMQEGFQKTYDAYRKSQTK